MSQNRYITLVDTVNEHLPLLHRYIKLRADILGLDEVKMYDVYAPLSQLEYKFTYDEAVLKTQETLAVFGPDYLERVTRSFNENGLMFMKTKANVQVLIQAGLMTQTVHVVELARHIRQPLYFSARDGP